jgi:putative oxidoreductase
VTASDLGLLVLRLVVGLTFAAHGAQKAFGWWNGPGWTGWHNAIGRMGFRPIGLFTTLSIGAELVGGLLLAFGFLTPVAAATLAAQSVVIILKVHAPSGFWNKNGGIEFPLVLGLGAVALGLTGAGAFSVDLISGFELSDSVRVALVIAGLAAGVLTFMLPTEAPRSDTKGPATRPR